MQAAAIELQSIPGKKEGEVRDPETRSEPVGTKLLIVMAAASAAILIGALVALYGFVPTSQDAPTLQSLISEPSHRVDARADFCGTGIQKQHPSQTEATHTVVFANTLGIVQLIRSKIGEHPLVSAVIIASVILLISAAVVCCVLFIPHSAPEPSAANRAGDDPRPSAAIPFYQTPAFIAAVAYACVGILVYIILGCVAKFHPIYLFFSILIGPCFLAIEVFLSLCKIFLVPITKCGKNIVCKIILAIIVVPIYLPLALVEILIAAVYRLAFFLYRWPLGCCVGQTGLTRIENASYALIKVAFHSADFLNRFIKGYLGGAPGSSIDVNIDWTLEHYGVMRSWTTKLCFDD